MKIGVLRERAPGETRAALMPESVRALVSAGATVSLESGAGIASGVSDADYTGTGAQIEGRGDLLATVDVLLCVNRPGDEDIVSLRAGTVVIGFLRPLDEPDAVVQLIEQKLTAFAMELIPRSTRA